MTWETTTTTTHHPLHSPYYNPHTHTSSGRPLPLLNHSSPTSSSQRSPSTATTAAAALPSREEELDGNGKPLIRTTDKSCTVCRDRRVRCGREWPTCQRCVKRREECVYGAGVTVEVKEDKPKVDPRIIELEAKLASLQSQLQLSKLASPISLSSTLSYSPPTLPSSSSSSTTPLETLLETLNPHSTPEESNLLLEFLMGNVMDGLSLGISGSLEWGLARGKMAEALVVHLLDASVQSCCHRLPAFASIVKRVPHLKASPHNLSDSDQAALSILCALGARASPHSAILGLSLPGLQDGSIDPAVFLTVGLRREKACRQLADRAGEMCWSGGVLKEGKRENVEVLVALGQLLLFQDVRPNKSRFFLRNAHGMYEDLQKSGELSDQESLELRKAVGSALFRDDSINSAQLSRPPLISTSELDHYFEDTGLRIPDFAHDKLATLLDDALRIQGGTGGGGGVKEEQMEHALAITATWVCYTQRSFARLTTGLSLRRPSAPSIINDLHLLWTQIDSIHASIQRLQQFLVSQQQSSSSSSEPTRSATAMDHYVLLAVRYDTRLVDLVNLLHGFLESHEWEQEEVRGGDGRRVREEVERLKKESEMRVRKCLKLVAFYTFIFTKSQDRHVVYHIVTQLELLPNWTHLAMQQVGDEGGPISEEFAVSSQELEWLTTALRLACFYTPLAYDRLQELTYSPPPSRDRTRTGSSATPSLHHSTPSASVSPATPFLSHTTLDSTPSHHNSQPQPYYAPYAPYPTTSYPTDSLFLTTPPPPLPLHRSSGKPLIATSSYIAPTPSLPPQQQLPQDFLPFTFDSYGFPSATNSENDPNKGNFDFLLDPNTSYYNAGGVGVGGGGGGGKGENWWDADYASGVNGQQQGGIVW